MLVHLTRASNSSLRSLDAAPLRPLLLGVREKALSAKSIFAVMLVAVSSAASAQQTFESIVIGCKDAPDKSVTQLAAPMSNWGRVNCTKFGHVIMAAEGWVWHSPMADQAVRLWAQSSAEEFSEVGHSAYFKSIQFEELAGDAAKSANETLAAALGASAQPISHAYRLTAVNSSNETESVFLVEPRSNQALGNLWGYSCNGDCTNPLVFMVFRP